MIRALVLAVLLAPAAASQGGGAGPVVPTPLPDPRSSQGTLMDLSLVEALSAIRQPQLAGLFSFINPKDAPFALADLLARDHGALKRYLGKLDEDRSVANGLTGWDHQVCGSLVNLYASQAGAALDKPKAKFMKKINECVLAPVVSLQDIVGRRRR